MRRATQFNPELEVLPFNGLQKLREWAETAEDAGSARFDPDQFGLGAGAESGLDD